MATFARITSLTSLFFVRWGGGGSLMFEATEKETLPEIYILVFHGLASREV